MKARIEINFYLLVVLVVTLVIAHIGWALDRSRLAHVTELWMFSRAGGGVAREQRDYWMARTEKAEELVWKLQGERFRLLEECWVGSDSREE